MADKLDQFLLLEKVKNLRRWHNELPETKEDDTIIREAIWWTTVELAQDPDNIQPAEMAKIKAAIDKNLTDAKARYAGGETIVTLADLKSVELSKFVDYCIRKKLLAVTAAGSFDGWAPFPARVAFEAKNKFSADTVMQAIALFGMRSWKEKKTIEKTGPVGQKLMTEVLSTIKSVAFDQTIDLKRFLSTFPDLLFKYRCYLCAAGTLKIVVDADGKQMLVPEPINFLAFGSIYDLSSWSAEKQALSKLYNSNFQSKAIIERQINETRPKWAAYITRAQISQYLRYAYHIPDKCNHVKDQGDLSSAQWAIFAHDKDVCMSCVIHALGVAGKDVTSLNGYVGKVLKQVV